jgi:amidase
VGNFSSGLWFLLERKSMLTKAQKEIYDSVAEKINEKGGFAVYPIEIPEAAHTNNTLKHNGLSVKDIACKF